MSNPGPLTPPTQDPDFHVHVIVGVMTFGLGLAAIVAFGGVVAWVIGSLLILAGLVVLRRGLSLLDTGRR